MKKIFLFILFLLIFTNSQAREYCEDGLRISDPIGGREFLSVGLLKSELDCLGKTEEAKKFAKLVRKNFTKAVEEGFPQYPNGKWRECGAKYIGDNNKALSDPVIYKKYYDCETKRIEKVNDDHVTFAINLFYSFAN